MDFVFGFLFVLVFLVCRDFISILLKDLDVGLHKPRSNLIDLQSVIGCLHFDVPSSAG